MTVMDHTCTEGLAAVIQKSLLEIYKAKAPELTISKQIGFLAALESDENLRGIEKIPVDQGDGSIRQFRITWIKRGCTTDITDTPVEGCETDLEKCPHEEPVELELYVGTKGLKFSESNMRRMREGDKEYIDKVINGEINAFLTAFNQRLLAIAAANFGVNPVSGNNLVYPINMLYGSKTEPLYFGESQMIDVFEAADAGGMLPLVIGSQNIGHYSRQAGIGCCNDGGIDLAKAGAWSFYRDRYLASILGANHFIGLIPGYVHLLTWAGNKGTYGKESLTFSHKTLVLPGQIPLEVDMNVHYFDCKPRYYEVDFGLWYKLQFLPTDVWEYCDELQGVNYMFHFRADKEDDPCCD